jgi:hypothetical protein
MRWLANRASRRRSNSVSMIEARVAGMPRPSDSVKIFGDAASRAGERSVGEGLGCLRVPFCCDRDAALFVTPNRA